MPALPMMITDAGRDAIVNAQLGGTEAVLITELGLSDTPFAIAPTLTDLPGEFRRIDTVSGQAVSETVIHVTAYDPAPIVYDVTGFGLYAADGTLVAVYSSNAAPILSKAALAVSLMALDISFASDVAAVIEFGDAVFSNPPATEDTAGVAQIATNAEADAGIDDGTIMTPKKVKRLIDAAINAAEENVIKIFWGAIVDIKPGWQLCDGTNGTPDLRDKFIVGAGGTYLVNATGGAVQHDHGAATQGHALTEAEMPAHKHANGITDSGVAADMFPYGQTASPGTPDSVNNDSADGTIQGWTSTVGDGGAHTHPITAANHLPPYFALAYIMKA